MEERNISAFLIFIGYGYLQHEKYGWQRFHSVRYHSYLIVLRYDLKDAVAFVDRASFAVIQKTVTGAGKKQRGRV